MRPALLALSVLAGAALAQDGGNVPRIPIGHLAEEIAECSGIDRQGDVFWTHSDSGNPPVLFAIDRSGAVLRTIDLGELGIENLDWEDLAVDGDAIYVGDIGDNRRARDALSVHRVLVEDGRPAVTTLRYSYPDARHDAEALFVREGRLWVLSKAREGYTNVYRLPEAFGAEPAPAELVGRLAVFGLVTAADYDPVERKLVVATYHQIHVFADAGGKHPFAGDPVLSVRIIAGQDEAICWDGEDVLFTNEGRDVFRLKRPLATRPRAFQPELPRAVVPRRGSAPLPLVLSADESGEPRDDAALSVAWSDEGLHLAGRCPISSPLPFVPEDSEFGASLHLLFGTDLERPLWFREGKEVHLFVAFDAEGRARLGRLSHDPRSRAPLEDVTASATVAGGLEDEEGRFELTIPFALLGVEDARAGSRLLFNCFALQTGEPNALHWSVEFMEATHEKPYTWGEWELGG